MNITDPFLSKSASWLDAKGAYSEIVLSTRIRLARNLSGFNFVHRMKVKELREVLIQVKKVCKESNTLTSNGDVVFIDLKELPPLDLEFLVERHLIGVDMASGGKSRGVVVGDEEKASVMINEEDHLRLQAFVSGLQPTKAYEIVNHLDNELEEQLEYAVSEDLGYLTACPTNTGTGIRGSILIHLPALVLTKEIDKVLRGVTQVGFAVRGLYGEGTEVKGNFFQISNQTTLGRSEEEIVESLERIGKQVIQYEREARDVLMKSARNQIEDKIWRAYGMLKYARVLTSDEFINLSSAVRLGVGIGTIRQVSLQELNLLLIHTQPAHLQKIYDSEMESEERDFRRAEYAREKLK
jgi:protein arginine kinase